MIRLSFMQIAAGIVISWFFGLLAGVELQRWLHERRG
jgi:hypothetical protein